MRHFFLFLCIPLARGQTPLELDGYIQGRFTNQEGTNERLEIRRARLILSGEPVTGVSYTVQVDPLHKPLLLDAAVTWKISKPLAITTGQFKIPFSAESLLADNREPPIERARAINTLVPGRDQGVQARDLGVQVGGTVDAAQRPILDYAVGMFAGHTMFDPPNPHFRATGARLILHPLRGVGLGGDWYGSFRAPGGKEKRRLEAEGEYARGGFQSRAEILWARDGTVRRRGGYALVAWRFSKEWEILGRADWLTARAGRPNQTSEIYIAGANYYFGKYMKLQANTGARHDPGGAGLSSVFLTQLQLGF